MNGNIVSSGSNTAISNVTRTNNYIARSNWSSDAYLDGKVSSLKIYNRALSSAEITQDFNSNSPA